MSRERYALPGGGETHKVNEYIAAWRDLGRPLAAAVEGELHSYDPDIAILVDGHIWTVPAAIAQRLLPRLTSSPPLVEDVVEEIWTVMRHGGRSTDVWRSMFKGMVSKDRAQSAFDRTKAKLRQGGVQLYCDGRLVDSASAPRLRNRW